jgi:dihydropteroate synthase
MGVINVTPDSFSGDGLLGSSARIAERAAALVAGGADIIDVGGESTRPGYTPVSSEDELQRVLPAIRMLASHFPIPISIDTSKAAVAGPALRMGASVVNDVSGLRDERMAAVVADAGAGLAIVHHQQLPPAPDLVPALVCQLGERVHRAEAAGVRPDAILVDPGLGMGKGWRENFEIMRHLDLLRTLGKPVLVGPSRKGMIGKVLGVGVRDRVEGTAALTVLCIVHGADAVRVHDVRALTRVCRMTDALAR